MGVVLLPSIHCGCCGAVDLGCSQECGPAELTVFDSSTGSTRVVPGTFHSEYTLDLTTIHRSTRNRAANPGGGPYTPFTDSRSGPNWTYDYERTADGQIIESRYWKQRRRLTRAIVLYGAQPADYTAGNPLNPNPATTRAELLTLIATKLIGADGMTGSSRQAEEWSRCVEFVTVGGTLYRKQQFVFEMEAVEANPTPDPGFGPATVSGPSLPSIGIVAHSGTPQGVGNVSIGATYDSDPGDFYTGASASNTYSSNDQLTPNGGTLTWGYSGSVVQSDLNTDDTTLTASTERVVTLTVSGRCDYPPFDPIPVLPSP